MTPTKHPEIQSAVAYAKMTREALCDLPDGTSGLERFTAWTLFGLSLLALLVGWAALTAYDLTLKASTSYVAHRRQLAVKRAEALESSHPAPRERTTKTPTPRRK